MRIPRPDRARGTEFNDLGRLMPLSNADKKRFRSIGHGLHPIVTIAEKGLSETVRGEIDRALSQHELIKVKVVGADREQKAELVKTLQKDFSAECVQQIGHVVLLYRAAKEPDPRLSNILRNP